jgi:hypothetical protein
VVIEYGKLDSPFNLVTGDALARSGVGTIIGRKTASKGREYTRIWIYVPTKVQEDTAFPFEVGDPCLVEIDEDGASLNVKKMSSEEAAEQGWQERKRRKPTPRRA